MQSAMGNRKYGSHRLSNVIFASDASDLVKAINRASAWPSFGFHVSELFLKLDILEVWRMVFKNRDANVGAFRIAQSVTLDNRLQSYVARGHPDWLSELFDCEKAASFE